MSDNDERATWVTLHSFNTGFEADLIRSMLEEEGIPVMQQSSAPGIFGASYQGSVTGGITLLVPSPELERARELIATDEPPTATA